MVTRSEKEENPQGLTGMNPSCYGVLKDAEESGKDPRNENSDSVSTRREHRHSSSRNPQRPSDQLKCERQMNPSQYDVEESEKELRDEKTGNVIQAGEKEMKKHASRQEGTPSRKPSRSDGFTSREHRRSSSRSRQRSSDQFKCEQQMNPSQYDALKDYEESGKDLRNEKSSNVIQTGENEMKKHASRQEGKLSRKRCKSNSSTRREHRRCSGRSPRRPSDQLKRERQMNPSRSDVLKDYKESGKDQRNEKSGNVIQAGENKMKNHASREEGTPSRKPGESDSSTRRKHRRSSSRRSLRPTDQLKHERQMNPSREEKISRKHRESDSSTRREYRHSYSRTKQQYRHEPNDHSYKPHHERQRHHNCYNQKHYRYTQPINRKRRCRSPYEKFGYCRNVRRTNNFREKEKYRYRFPIRFIKGAYHRKEYTPRYSYREQGRREQHVDASKDCEYKNVQRKKRARDYYENNDEEKRICPTDDESRVKKRRTENSEKAENKKCFDRLNDDYGNCSDDCSSDCSLKPNGANTKKYVRKGHKTEENKCERPSDEEKRQRRAKKFKMEMRKEEVLTKSDLIFKRKLEEARIK